MGKRCLSRGVSVESPKLYSLPNGCYGGEPGEFFFPGPRRRFFSFRTSTGSFLLAFPFLLREKKREILDARAVRPYWPGRYCRLFSLGINSGYILDAASRTVSPRIKCGMTKGGYSLDPASSAG